MSSWTHSKYKTRNWAEYNLSLQKPGSLSLWFDAEMDWGAAPSGKRGRQQVYSDAAIQACLTIKVLFGLPLRQATGFVESLLKLIGLNWLVPDFSALCRPLPGSRNTVSIRGAKDVASRHSLSRLIRTAAPSDPLSWFASKPLSRCRQHMQSMCKRGQLTVPGIKAPSRQHPADAPAGQRRAKASGTLASTPLTHVSMCSRSKGGSKRRLWRKIHISIDERPPEISVIEATSSRIGPLGRLRCNRLPGNGCACTP
jgi:hypothetical protein